MLVVATAGWMRILRSSICAGRRNPSQTSELSRISSRANFTTDYFFRRFLFLGSVLFQQMALPVNECLMFSKIPGQGGKNVSLGVQPSLKVSNHTLRPATSLTASHHNHHPPTATMYLFHGTFSAIMRIQTQTTFHIPRRHDHEPG